MPVAWSCSSRRSPESDARESLDSAGDPTTLTRAMLASIDNNIWGLLVVPVGVALGFGPAILAWLWMSRGQTRKSDHQSTTESEE